jgi:mRNA interferase MazF
LKRGDIVTVVLSGDYGKPRPALVVQSDLFNETHASVTVIPITSEIVDAPDFRLTMDPSPGNGLRRVSQLMIDKLVSVRRQRIGTVIGRLDATTLIRVNRAMVVWLGIV